MTGDKVGDVSNQRLRKAAWLFLVLVLIGSGVIFSFRIASENYWSRYILPGDMTHVTQYFTRFGEPHFVIEFQREGEQYFEFHSKRPSSTWELLLAPVSSKPCYLFNAQGEFIAWSADPHDDPDYSGSAGAVKREEVSLAEVKRKFGL